VPHDVFAVAAGLPSTPCRRILADLIDGRFVVSLVAGEAQAIRPGDELLSVNDEPR